MVLEKSLDKDATQTLGCVCPFKTGIRAGVVTQLVECFLVGLNPVFDPQHQIWSCRTWEVKAGGFEIQDQPQTYGNFKTSQGCKRSCLKSKSNRQPRVMHKHSFFRFFPNHRSYETPRLHGYIGSEGKRHLSAERAPGDLTFRTLAWKRGVLACLGTHSCPSHFPRHGIEKPWHLLGISTEKLPVRPGSPFNLAKWIPQMLPCLHSCLYTRGKCFNPTFPLLSTNVHLSDISSSAFIYEDSSTHINMQISNSNYDDHRPSSFLREPIETGDVPKFLELMAPPVYGSG